MDKNVPSGTFKKLYAKILGPLFKQLCDANPNYAVKVNVNHIPMPAAVWFEYNNYREYFIATFGRMWSQSHWL